MSKPPAQCQFEGCTKPGTVKVRRKLRHKGSLCLPQLYSLCPKHAASYLKS